MNTRSLKTQLILWYVGLLTGCFGLLAAVTYLALQNSLVDALKESQLRRARQVAQLLREEVEHRRLAGVGEEVETRYTPDINDRFIRITRRDGVVLYLSDSPRDQSFDPASLPPAAWSPQIESARQVPLLGGRKMLLAAHAVQAPDGTSYLVEAGAPMDQVRTDLRKWLVFLLALFPAVALIALGGGYLLVKRSLAPVDRITASAERISSYNLSERLPVAQTGDELERLSVALNRMIERLDAAFQQSRRFVADASHELRTPLTVLRGELEDLVQGPQLPGDWRERLGTTLEEVDRLATIVEGLFAISRLDAGEAAAEWLKFDLAQLATDTADQMSLLAEDKGIRLSATAPKSVWVEGDRSRLKQVVVNLLDNAIKYTSQGGAIELSVNAQSTRAVLEVSDTGIGIPATALRHIFERFYRVDKARSRQGGGAGLGLSIVRSICTAHQGKVEASSTPGQGSHFRVELPLVAAPANPHPEKKNHEHSCV